jgi:hypothetical protein
MTPPSTAPLGQTTANMAEPDRDTAIRITAFEHVRRLCEVHDHLTAAELKPGLASGSRS